MTEIPVYVHLRRAKDLIDRDFAEPLDVVALAREAHASRAHFICSFKRAFGETPHRYLQRRRIERAKELLRNTPLSVTEITFAVGFRSVGSFSSVFHRLVGRSEEHTSELQSLRHLVCRLLLEKKKR